MKSIIIMLLLMGATSHAGDMIGLAGVGLCADNPAELAEWYQQFDINLTEDKSSGIFSGMSGSKNYFHVAIMPADPNNPYCQGGAKGFGFSLHVDGFESYRNQLNDKGLRPFGPILRESWGCMANYIDPAGNSLSIFSLATTEEGGTGVSCQ